ncbi:MAG: two pore domain potassium channel family protein [Actinobacteria bacterium]|nr:two pore domain potassium channel family protein [Actinomycetota bacterium]
MYFLLAVSDPGQFTGLATRLDALYLSMATVSTVGFGDVSATGQAARAVVTVQMAFNLAFVASLVSLFQARLQQNRARRGEDGGDHTA